MGGGGIVGVFYFSLDMVSVFYVCMGYGFECKLYCRLRK